MQINLCENASSLQVPEVEYCGGLAKIVRATSSYVYEVEDLITKRVKEAHVSRLRFYAHDTLNVCEQFMSHEARSQGAVNWNHSKAHDKATSTRSIMCGSTGVAWKACKIPGSPRPT